MRTSSSLLFAAFFAAFAAFLPQTMAVAPPHRVKLTFVTHTSSHAFRLEVADTPRLRERGLMHRTKIPADGGMLFTFDQAEDHIFWMKDTPLPLDLIFIDEHLEVVGVISRATPETLMARHIGKPSRLVVELLGGTAARLHIAEGSHIEIEGGVPGMP